MDDPSDWSRALANLVRLLVLFVNRWLCLLSMLRREA